MSVLSQPPTEHFIVAETEFLNCPICNQTFLSQGSALDRYVQCAHCAHLDARQAFPSMQAPRPGHFTTQLPSPRPQILSSELSRPGIPLNNSEPSPLPPELPRYEHTSYSPEPAASRIHTDSVPPVIEPVPLLEQESPGSDVIQFDCPACRSSQEISAEIAGEAIDCSSCGVAVVSPDPSRGQPAILFHELLAKMGITPPPLEPAVAEPETAAQRQIAEFQLHPAGEAGPPAEPDPMAWLEQASEPDSSREPLWPNPEIADAPVAEAPPAPAAEPAPEPEPEPTKEAVVHPATSEAKSFRISKRRRPAATFLKNAPSPARRRDPRSTPLRIATPSRRQSTVPRRSFTRSEVITATAAVIAVGAVSYALFLSPDDPPRDSELAAAQPTTVVVTQPSPEAPTGEPAEPIASRPSGGAIPENFEFNETSVVEEQPPATEVEKGKPQEIELAPEIRQPPNEKILNFERSRDALRAFCKATSPEEMLKYVLKPDVNEESVYRYFEEHGPACFQLRELIHGQTAQSDTDGRYWSSFLVQTNKNPRGFAVTVRETESGPRLSWPAFIQHHDGVFEHYLEKQPLEPQIFCANISRGYSIDPSAPDPKKFHCFRIRGSESPRSRTKAYVDRSSYLGEQLERNVDWDSEVPITVELQWETGEEDQPPRLFIREVLEYLW